MQLLISGIMLVRVSHAAACSQASLVLTVSQYRTVEHTRIHILLWSISRFLLLRMAMQILLCFQFGIYIWDLFLKHTSISRIQSCIICNYLPL